MMQRIFNYLTEGNGFFSILFLSLLIFFNPLNADRDHSDLETLYRDAKFQELSEKYQTRDFTTLSRDEKFLFIESLARTGKGESALEKLQPYLNGKPSTQTLTLAGIVYLSLGKFEQSREYLEKALESKPGSLKATVAKIMLHLYMQQYGVAVVLYGNLLNKYPEWSDSLLFFNIGTQLYKAAGEPQGLLKLYRRHAKNNKKNKAYARNLKTTVRLYKKAGKGKLYQVEAAGDRVVIPFTAGLPDSPHHTIKITVKGKTYNVLLDTGNAVGWMLHNRDLMKEFNALQGSMIKTRMGTQDGMLDGYTIYSKTADFGPFKMNGLIGVYVPKPHRDFYDANLNPAFIKNRVVTIDYVKKQLILRTKAAFDSDMASLDAGPAGVVQLPWYGYKHVYVPVQLKGNGTGSGYGLAMLETGAEDIALRLEFARKHGLQLTPAVKYLANGKVFHYFKSAVKLTLGTVPFQRKAADVWPLDRFHDQITGLGADVVMGPAAFANKNIISFDPIAKQVVIRK